MILADHKEMRTRLERLGKLLDKEHIEAHGDQVGEARKEFKDFAQFFGAHLDFEDQFLAPLLREDFAWGDLRADALLRHHKEQRDELIELTKLVTDKAGDRQRQVSALEQFVAHLEMDMKQEEGSILEPDTMGEEMITVEAGA
jgi:iron-sulfur cluster repair protein YtfE (RIC family)